MTAPVVDRQHPVWGRLRASVCELSPIDHDAHADQVFLDLERLGALKKANGGGRASIPAQAPASSQETS